MHDDDQPDVILTDQESIKNYRVRIYDHHELGEHCFADFLSFRDSKQDKAAAAVLAWERIILCPYDDSPPQLVSN